MSVVIPSDLSQGQAASSMPATTRKRRHPEQSRGIRRSYLWDICSARSKPASPGIFAACWPTRIRVIC